MRILVVVMSIAWALLTGATTARAQAPGPVAVDILVVQASRSAGKMDARLKKQPKLMKQLRTAGFKSARVSDELKTKVEVGARVGLMLASKKSRELQVRVKEVTPKKRIKLTVGIKAFGFEIDTEHANGGTIVVAHQQGPDAAVFLAVTPKL